MTSVNRWPETVKLVLENEGGNRLHVLMKISQAKKKAKKKTKRHPPSLTTKNKCCGNKRMLSTTRFPLCCSWICKEVVQITDRVVLSITRWTAGTHSCISCYLSYRKEEQTMTANINFTMRRVIKNWKMVSLCSPESSNWYQSHFLTTQIHLHTIGPHICSLQSLAWNSTMMQRKGRIS